MMMTRARNGPGYNVCSRLVGIFKLWGQWALPLFDPQYLAALFYLQLATQFLVAKGLRHRKKTPGVEDGT